MWRQAINQKTSTYCNPVHESGNKDSENNTFAALLKIAQNDEVTQIFFGRSQRHFAEIRGAVFTPNQLK